MGDLDSCLITEFAKRPGFYDRSSVYFKDKLYIENSWRDISNELGYEVGMLKERMYQLRNRYNLEKRKLETLKSEDSQSPKSTWNLFQQLAFLDGHIRPRKSYKSMMRKAYEEEEEQNRYHNSSRNNMNSITKVKDNIPIIPRRRGRPRKNHVLTYAEDGDDDTHNVNNVTTTNGVAGGGGVGGSGINAREKNLIKHELISESDENTHDESFLNPAHLLADNNPSTSRAHQSQIQNSTTENHALNSTISTTNMNKRRRDDTIIHLEDEGPSRKKDKFSAFGEFITASLTDMSESIALDLIETFTIQLVSAMRKNK